MDKLSESQRASIAKMSDERLQSKLSRAGYAPEILTQFTRSDLMKAVAEVIIAEDEQQAAAASQFGVEEGVEDRPTEMESMAEVQMLWKNGEFCWRKDVWSWRRENGGLRWS